MQISIQMGTCLPQCGNGHETQALSEQELHSVTDEGVSTTDQCPADPDFAKLCRIQPQCHSTALIPIVSVHKFRAIESQTN